MADESNPGKLDRSQILRVVARMGALEALNSSSRKFLEAARDEMESSKLLMFAGLTAAAFGDTLGEPESKPVKSLEQVMLCDDIEFESRFRITRKTVRIILDEFRVVSHEDGVYEGLLFTLYYLGQSGPTTDWDAMASKFRTTPDSYREAVINFAALVVNKLKDRFVRWPSDMESKEVIEASIERRFNFPNVFGFLGCVFLHNNRVALEVVVDHNHNFRWVFAVEDVKTPMEVLYVSDLRDKIMAQDSDDEKFLLASPVYQCFGQVLPPFYHPSSEDEVKFNQMHSKALDTLALAIQLLTSRFPALGFLDFSDLKHSCTVIEAACVLQNVCLTCHDLASASCVTSFDYSAPV